MDQRRRRIDDIINAMALQDVSRSSERVQKNQKDTITLPQEESKQIIAEQVVQKALDSINVKFTSEQHRQKVTDQVKETRC